MALSFRTAAEAVLPRLFGIFLYAYALPHLLFRPLWTHIVAATQGAGAGGADALSTGAGVGGGQKPVDVVGDAGDVRPLFGSAMEAMIWGTFAVHLLAYLVNHAFYAALYSGYFRPLQQYRVIPKAWPWQRPPVSETHPHKLAEGRFWRDVRDVALLWVFNNVVLGIPLSYITFSAPTIGGYGDISLEGFPSPTRIGFQLLVCILLEDVLFYTTHRLLHTPWLCAHVHKLHHSFSHTVSFAAEYAHPVEYVLGNALPFIAGPKLVRAHMVTLWIWMILRITATSEGHSGFCFPFSPSRIWPSQGEEHDAHHSVNTGTYGSAFPFWDWLFGTGIPHDVVLRSNLRKPRPCDADAQLLFKKKDT